MRGRTPNGIKNFTGRESLLQDIHDKLSRTQQTAVLPQALHGMGGVGKSQVAIEYVHRHSADYDLIWWVPAARESQILTSLTQLAKRLRLDITTEAVTAVREALSTGASGYQDWLLVFDNAEAPQDVKKYFPTGGAGKILVTSRDLEWSRVTRSIEVDVFTRDESKAFLRGRNPNLSDTDAERLAEALGDLPLAIEQAAAWRAATGMSVDEYLSLLETKRNEVLQASPSPDYPESVAAALKLSFEKLRAVNPEALQLLQICAVIAPEPISPDLLTGAGTAPSAEDGGDTLLSNRVMVFNAIADIQRFALAKIDTERNVLQIHRLVQGVLKDHMSADEENLVRRRARILLARNAHDASRQSDGRDGRKVHYQADQITIGAVAGTVFERIAVERVLDDVAQLQYGDDPQLYLVGTVPSRDPLRPHVLALALQTSDGARDAAFLCGRMARTFAHLAGFVTCGLATGVPSSEPGRQVALGDIVVATNLVDYRSGRRVDGIHTGRQTPQRPGTVWVNADHDVQVAELKDDKPPWLSLLEIASNDPAFRRPGPGQPRVHRGPVGSADAEVLDATVRDDIAREHRIVALDLQGAGIAIGSHRAEHSWFMVAGIADHGDNASGSDQWSRYAAMAAACYLRTMLERAPATGLNAAG